MTARVVFTLQGKREHLAIFIPGFGWTPVCGEVCADSAFWYTQGSVEAMGWTPKAGRSRRPCRRCPLAVAELAALDSQLTRAQFAAASTEER